MAGKFLNLFKFFRKKKKKGFEADPAQQLEEPQAHQPLQGGVAMDSTKGQKPIGGHFRRTLKMFRMFVPIRRRKTSMTETESTSEPDSSLSEVQAEPDVIPESPERSKDSDTAVNDDQAKDDTAVTELSEDSETAMDYDRVKAVLLELTEDMAITNTDTRMSPDTTNTDTTPTPTGIDASSTDLFEDSGFISDQQATVVLWVIVQVPECHEAMVLYSSRLLVALLFHAVITTELMPPEEVNNFWRACREEHRLPSKPNRFAVRAMKALLCRMQCEGVVMAIERKRGWDTLLCADTQHYATALLAREMRHAMIPLCSHIALHLLRLLSIQEPHWDLPFLAFLVEVLDCLDFMKYGCSIMRILSRYLQGKSRERRRLALRGLVVVSKDPWMAKGTCSLSRSLLELLDDADGEVVGMTLRVLMNVLQNKNILISSITAPKLAEALVELFDHDNSYVQLISIQLFYKVMELVVDDGKKSLKTIVHKSLYPLLIYCHDENQHLAKASRETLVCVAKFLNRRNLEKMLKKEQPLRMNECLVAKDRSRAAEHLRQALQCLQSPKEPLRAAAIRVIGTTGQNLRGKKEQLQVLDQARQTQKKDTSPSGSNLENSAQFRHRDKELESSSESCEPVSQEQPTRRH